MSRRPIPVTRRESPYAPPSEADIACARQMYIDGFTVSRILARCDMALGTLYYWLDGGPNEAGGPALPPIPRRRVVVGKRRRALRGDAVSLHARLYRTAERQARDIEMRLAQAGRPASEREADARMLARLVRTLRDLAGLGRPEAGAAATLAAHEPPAADAEALRAELARRLDALAAQAKADCPEDAGVEADGRGGVSAPSERTMAEIGVRK